MTAPLFCAASFLADPFPIAAQNGTPSEEWNELSIEQLINIEVTSVSKKETKLAESPAAVAVLTTEDVAHLGATTLPEALRSVPGVNVARINANKWAVSVRGFNDEFANKLLVLLDGRSIYTPSIGGVYWNQHDVVMEDLERIEVVRGPGGTLWGANAVNGVINIITKNAKDTQGFLSSATVGTEDQPSMSLRHGGKLSTNAFYRIYGSGFNRDGFDDANGRSMSDDWQMGRAGVRVDWDLTERDAVTLLGEYHRGVYGEQVYKQSMDPPAIGISEVRVPTQGGHALGRWSHTLSEQSDFTLQAYYDHYDLQHAFGGATIDPVPDVPRFLRSNNAMSEARDTADIDFQHRFAPTDRNEVVWGAGYRYTVDRFGNDASSVRLDPDREEDHLFSAFLQDEISLVPDHLRFTLGSKFEHNDVTGFEIQPGTRLLWIPAERHSAWISASRAVRTPTRMERGLDANMAAVLAPDNTPLLVQYSGDPNLNSEKLIAYEAGYRFEPTRRLSFDIAGFFNQYDDLIQARFDPDQPGSFTHANTGSGHTYGAELLAHWQVLENWRLTGNYTWLRASLPRDDLQDTINPEHQFHLRSHVDLTKHWEWVTAAYYVDAVKLHSALPIQTRIPSYVRLDLGLTWRPNANFELGLWGQNLLDPGHREYPSLKTPNIAEVPRSFFAKITLRF